jgi:hypothetical protein
MRGSRQSVVPPRDDKQVVELEDYVNNMAFLLNTSSNSGKVHIESSLNSSLGPWKLCAMISKYGSNFEKTGKKIVRTSCHSTRRRRSTYAILGPGLEAQPLNVPQQCSVSGLPFINGLITRSYSYMSSQLETVIPGYEDLKNEISSSCWSTWSKHGSLKIRATRKAS